MRLPTAIALTAILLTSGCASRVDDRATITYETAAGREATSFPPPEGIACDNSGASGLRFPELPLNEIQLSFGSHDEVSILLDQGDVTYFEGEDIEVIGQRLDDGRLRYTLKDQPGVVTVVPEAAIGDDGEFDRIRDGETFDGTLDLTITCTEEEE